jgi:LacI family transcriptional regulator
VTDRPASIDDVAQRAGVSTATVSRVLNNPEKVAPATAERVREAIEHLDYRPNQFASGLMTRRSRVIGLVVPDGFEGVTVGMLRLAEDEARRLGFHLLLMTESRLCDAEEVRGSPAFGMLDAIAVVSTHPPASVLEIAATLGVPVATARAGSSAGTLPSRTDPLETVSAVVRTAIRLALDRL